jgi:hypothetical protein
MTDAEKLQKFSIRIAPDTGTDEMLSDILDVAGSLILNKMYPFGAPDGTTVPTRYEQLQIQLAVELYSQRGAEGQISHSENGINRSWPEKNRLLAQVLPQCGSVGG